MAEHKNQKEEDLGASWGQQQKPLVWYNLKDRYTESGCHGQAEKMSCAKIQSENNKHLREVT